MELPTLYGQIFDAVRDPLLVLDENGDVRAANAAAMRWFELGAGVVGLVRAPDARVALDVRGAVSLVRRGERVRGIPIPDPSGRETGILADVEPIEDAPGCSLLHFRAGAETCSRELWTDDAVASVAHEFRNPLAAMRSALDAMAAGDAGPMTEAQQRLVGAVRRGAARLGRIVDGYLDLARVRAGVLAVERADHDVRNLIVEVTGDLAALQPGLGARLDVEVAHDVRDAYVDRDRMGQILLNLVCNASRFTPGDRRIAVRASRAGREALDDDLRLLPWEVLGDPRWVRFDVEDQGIGMSHETLAHVFERYHGCGKEPCAPASGAHLGLHISQTLAQAHDGWMKVDSRLGEGTVVSVFVPEDEHTATLVSRIRMASTVVRRLRAARRPVTLALLNLPAPAGSGDAAAEWSAVATVNPTRAAPAPDRPCVWMVRDQVAVVVVAGTSEETDLERRFAGAAAQEDGACGPVAGACVIDDGSTFAQALRLATTRMVHRAGERRTMGAGGTGNHDATPVPAGANTGQTRARRQGEDHG